MERSTYGLSLDIDVKDSTDRQNAFFVVVVENTQQVVDEFDMAFDFSLIYDFFSNIFGLFMFSFGFNSSLNKKIPEVFEGDLKSK